MKKSYRILFFLVAFIVVTGCEEEGEPLTLDDLFQLNGLPTKRFEVILNGFKFETNTASGLKTNTALSIEASGSGASYMLAVSDIVEGEYFGNTDDFKVFLNYKNSGGLLFSTTKSGETSDLEVEITNYDVEKDVVSGKFQGTLLQVNGDLELNVTKGSFLEIPIVRPAFGEMIASIDSERFVAESCLFTSSTSGGFTFDTFSGVGNDDSTILNITVQEKIQEREYQFSSGSITATYNPNTFSSNIFKNQYDAEAGSLTISKIDTINNAIEGRFNFTVRNAFGEPINIFQGEFNALIK
ncbi:DUF6252 family protein [Vicingaceae bacterium]|nr:DUF6252 family protein [Vicingaceae bacterium]MDC1452063.1 DUF6252 family protein [Vicingaceae bacterium]